MGFRKVKTAALAVPHKKQANLSSDADNKKLLSQSMRADFYMKVNKEALRCTQDTKLTGNDWIELDAEKNQLWDGVLWGPPSLC